MVCSAPPHPHPGTLRAWGAGILVFIIETIVSDTNTQQKFCGMPHVFGFMFSLYMGHFYRILVKTLGGLICTWGN